MRQRQAIADAWTIIDCVHRAGELFLIAKVAVNRDEDALLKSIKTIRNSYQHANERIEEYFSSKGGSVFGDLSWYYHPDLFRPGPFEGVLYEYIMQTGITHKDEFEVTSGDPEQLKFVDIISFVRIHYVTKSKSKLTVSLDDASALINRAIVRIGKFNKSIDEEMAQKLAIDPTLRRKGFLPVTIVATHHFTRALKGE
ncbi:hypothetical protein [Hymenobacter nivis]|uniref:Uncharacterized protein n=1 Tax=Hymenobacter nivis TaxID=1850093 RepID=A0A2Z3H292_9BACT|nr:hypothetical protein [Hymenobacter nivis]AWM35130.1 hypothetical protein DDQ68_21595 [Hymenobacter nivis]